MKRVTDCEYPLTAEYPGAQELLPAEEPATDMSLEFGQHTVPAAEQPARNSRLLRKLMLAAAVLSASPALLAALPELPGDAPVLSVSSTAEESQETQPAETALTTEAPVSTSAAETTLTEAQTTEAPVPADAISQGAAIAAAYPQVDTAQYSLDGLFYMSVKVGDAQDTLADGTTVTREVYLSGYGKLPDNFADYAGTKTADEMLYFIDHPMDWLIWELAHNGIDTDGIMYYGTVKEDNANEGYSNTEGQNPYTLRYCFICPNSLK